MDFITKLILLSSILFHTVSNFEKQWTKEVTNIVFTGKLIKYLVMDGEHADQDQESDHCFALLIKMARQSLP